MEDLMTSLKGQLIEQLNLEDVEIADIGNDEQLFGGDLDLDSIDALEIIVLLEREYGLKVENPKEGRKIFESIRTLAEFITENQKS